MFGYAPFQRAARKPYKLRFYAVGTEKYVGVVHGTDIVGSAYHAAGSGDILIGRKGRNLDFFDYFMRVSVSAEVVRDGGNFQIVVGAAA